MKDREVARREKGDVDTDELASSTYPLSFPKATMKSELFPPLMVSSPGGITALVLTSVPSETDILLKAPEGDFLDIRRCFEVLQGTKVESPRYSASAVCPYC